MKKIFPYILVVIISSSISFGLFYFINGNKKKTGYVQLAKVYKEFDLTKNLDAQFKKTATNRKNYIDSLEFQVKAIYTKASYNRADKSLQAQFENAQRQYMYHKEQMEESVGALEQQYTEQIWKQLNDFVTQYGKENGYTYIFGAEGSGSIMYGNEAEDLTDKLILYVNEKYQGK